MHVQGLLIHTVKMAINPVHDLFQLKLVICGFDLKLYARVINTQISQILSNYQEL